MLHLHHFQSTYGYRMVCSPHPKWWCPTLVTIGLRSISPKWVAVASVFLVLKKQLNPILFRPFAGSSTHPPSGHFVFEWPMHHSRHGHSFDDGLDDKVHLHEWRAIQFYLFPHKVMFLIYDPSLIFATWELITNILQFGITS